MNCLQHDFDDMPLIIEGGKSAGFVSGSAQIEYFTDGTWGIISIFLDGQKPITVTEVDKTIARIKGVAIKTHEPAPFFLEATSPIHGIIYHRLENECRDAVQTKVREAIADDRDQRVAAYNDYRRATRMDGIRA
jgi:hypothetical protein